MVLTVYKKTFFIKSNKYALTSTWALDLVHNNDSTYKMYVSPYKGISDNVLCDKTHRLGPTTVTSLHDLILIGRYTSAPGRSLKGHCKTYEDSLQMPFYLCIPVSALLC